MRRTFASLSRAEQLDRILKRSLVRDHVISAFTPSLRISMIQATNTVEQGRSKFKVTNPHAARHYGMCLTSSALMASMLRGEERLIVQYAGADSDPISRIYAESIHVGEVKGFIGGTKVQEEFVQDGIVFETPESKWDGLLRTDGQAVLSVSKILYGHAKPFQSILNVKHGELESEIQEYYKQSDQVDTIFRVETDVDALTGNVVYSGGIIVQRIAAAGGNKLVDDEEENTEFTTFESLREILKRNEPLAESFLAGSHYRLTGDSELFSLARTHKEGIPLATVLTNLLPELEGYDVLMGNVETGSQVVTFKDGKVCPWSETSPIRRTLIDFHCRCTKDKFMEHVARLGQQFVDEMEQEAVGKLLPGAELASDASIMDLNCQFCNTDYSITVSDLPKLREQINKS